MIQNQFGPIGIVALKKFGKVPENFYIYEVSVIGDHRVSDVWKVKGCVLREATKGKNKGCMCVIVPGSKVTAYVTRAEVKKVKP